MVSGIECVLLMGNGFMSVRAALNDIFCKITLWITC